LLYDQAGDTSSHHWALQGYIAHEKAICWYPSIHSFTGGRTKWQILNRPHLDAWCFYKKMRRSDFFLWRKDIDRGVFLIRLSRNWGMSVWRTVRDMINCPMLAICWHASSKLTALNVHAASEIFWQLIIWFLLSLMAGNPNRHEACCTSLWDCQLSALRSALLWRSRGEGEVKLNKVTQILLLCLGTGFRCIASLTLWLTYPSAWVAQDARWAVEATSKYLGIYGVVTRRILKLQ
jgi:hypothetical protein